MSWAYKRRAIEYHIRRERREGFKSGFALPTPRWQLLKMSLTPPVATTIRSGGFFYMSLIEYTEHLVKTARELIEAGKEELVKNIALLSRKSYSKDPVLLLAHQLKNRDYIDEVLKTFPPNLIERFIDIRRKAKPEYLHLVGSFGRKKKRAIERVLQELNIDTFEYYAIRYRESMRNILRLVHPRLDGERSALAGWVLGKKPAPTEKTELFDKIIRDPDKKKYLGEAIDKKLPFEVVRSIIGFPDDPATLREIYLKLATPITAFMQLPLKYPDVALEVIDKFKDRVPAQYIAKALFGILLRRKTEPPLTILNALDSALQKKNQEIKLLTSTKYVLLLDLSGSMDGDGIRRAVSIVYPLRHYFEETYGFNDEVFEIEVKELNDVLRLIESPSGGTALVHAVKTMEKKEKPLLVVTDEQGNIGGSYYDPRVPTYIVNVMAYPTETFPVKEDGNVVKMAGGLGLDSVRVSLSVVNVLKQTDEIVVDEAVEILRRYL